MTTPEPPCIPTSSLARVTRSVAALAAPAPCCTAAPAEPSTVTTSSVAIVARRVAAETAPAPCCTAAPALPSTVTTSSVAIVARRVSAVASPPPCVNGASVEPLTVTSVPESVMATAPKASTATDRIVSVPERSRPAITTSLAGSAVAPSAATPGMLRTSTVTSPASEVVIAMAPSAAVAMS